MFSFTAEEDDSESSSRDNWPTSASLFSSSSCRFVSVRSSSSEGFWGMLGAEANCEYVWKSVSVYRYSLAVCSSRWLGLGAAHGLLTCCSRARACWRSCAHPPPVEDMTQSGRRADSANSRQLTVDEAESLDAGTKRSRRGGSHGRRMATKKWYALARRISRAVRPQKTSGEL